VAVCVLTVRDNELDVGDSEVVSLEVAEGGDACGKAQGSHMNIREEPPQQASSGFLGKAGEACH
jgi:hypothetical protein